MDWWVSRFSSRLRSLMSPQPTGEDRSLQDAVADRDLIGNDEPSAFNPHTFPPMPITWRSPALSWCLGWPW